MTKATRAMRGNFCAYLLGVTALTGFAAPAYAQDAAAPATATASSDIIVTARKTSERLLDVPVAVSVLSGQALETKNAVSLRDVATFTPGLMMRESPSTTSATTIALRGQFQNDILATLEPSVGTYVDGMYWGRAYGINSDLLDVQSVQVLKGPQGTLFGRNTSAGALVITTARPSFDGVSGQIQATYGSYNERAGTGIVNIPLSDTLAVRGAVRVSKRDGFARDYQTGKRYNDKDNLQGRVRALWQITPDVSLDVSAELFHAEGNSPAKDLIYMTAGNQTTYINSGDLTANEINALTTSGLSANLVGVTQTRVYPSLPFAGTNFMTAHTYAGTLTAETGLGTVKFINGYRSVIGRNSNDLDGTSADIYLTHSLVNLKQLSTELQLTGKVDRLTYALGATYFSEFGSDRSYTRTLRFVPSLGNLSSLSRHFGTISNRSWGIYGQGTYAITDQLNFTGGLRYSHDKKGIVAHPSGSVDTNLKALACTGGSLLAQDCAIPNTTSFSNVSYTAGLDYKITPDVMIYAKYGRGYRAGGQQLRAQTLADATNPFLPEVNNEAEIGLKGKLLDNRLTFALAAYANKITGAQRSYLANTRPSQTLLENANVRGKGLEADLSLRVTDDFTLGFSGSISEVHYTSYQGRVLDGRAGSPTVGQIITIDKTGNRFDGIPDSSYNVSLDYKHPFQFATISANVTYAWQAAYATAPDSFNLLTTYAGNTAAEANAIIAATTKPAAGILNARVAASMADGKYEVALWGRNMTDKRFYQHALLLGGFVNGTPNDPATYGVTATVKF